MIMTVQILKIRNTLPIKHLQVYLGTIIFRISTSPPSEGYPYIMLWQGSEIRTGYLPFCYGDADENHEYFAFDGDTFNSVSESYFCDSYLFTSYNSSTLWWNGNLPDTTDDHLSTNCSAGTPQLEYPFLVPWWSEAYQVKSWIA